MEIKPPPTKGSFRVPNSIVQGLTTSTACELNRLGAFQMVTLLGLLTKVAPKAPEREVRMGVSEILEVIEVSKQVAHVVNREWETESGETRRQRYQGLRFSPKHMQQVHKALLDLYDTSVLIRRWDKSGQHRLDDRQVHVLDMFGYSYRRDGKELDLDDLPVGHLKVNVGTQDRPVYRIRRQTENGDRYDHPSGIVFRLNTELAQELAKARGTVGFTILARRVFTLFKRYMRTPAMIRLIILILRQTGSEFTRGLRQVLDDLGFDVSHPARAVQDLEEALAELQRVQLVVNFTLDAAQDTFVVERNTNWHREEVVCA